MWFCFFKQKTAYEMRISDWSSDVCSSDLIAVEPVPGGPHQLYRPLDPLVADREQAAQIDKCGDTLRAEILRRQRFREDRVPFRRHHRSFSARAPFEWPGQKTAGKDHAARQLGLAIAKQQVMERPRLDIVLICRSSVRDPSEELRLQLIRRAIIRDPARLLTQFAQRQNGNASARE